VSLVIGNAYKILVAHQLVTRDNVDHLYANDALLGVEPYARF